MVENQKIRFGGEFVKLHGQTSGELVAVFAGCGGDVLHFKFPRLVGYDTELTNGQFYFLNPEKTYLFLLFIGNDGILVPTFRAQNEENMAKYADNIGSKFDFVIEETPKGALYGKL